MNVEVTCFLDWKGFYYDPSNIDVDVNMKDSKKKSRLVFLYCPSFCPFTASFLAIISMVLAIISSA